MAAPDSGSEVPERRVERLQEIEAIKQRREERNALRKTNIGAESHRPDAAFFKSLDSSIKKIPPFIKKLNTQLKVEFEASLLQDVSKFNLSRYISEVIVAVGTANLRLNDVSTAVKICSILYRYYEEFIPGLMRHLYRVFDPEKKESLSRRRSTLKFITDLYLSGATSDYRPILKIVKYLVDHFDASPSDTLTILLSFSKYAARTIMGITEVLPGESLEEDEIFVDEDGRKNFLNCMEKLWTKVTAHLLTLHKELRENEKHNRRVEESKGELSAEQKQNYEQQRQEYEKVIAAVQGLAEIYHKEMVQLPVEENRTRMTVTVGTGDMFKVDRVKQATMMWNDDEDIRAFYEDLPDLTIRVFPELLGIKPPGTEGETSPEAKGEEKKEEEAKPKEQSPQEATPADTNAPADKPDELDDDDTEEITPAQQDKIAEFVKRIEGSMNREKIDKAAEDFCYMASKGNRKKLVSALFKVSRQKLELLPYYARLVAILNQYYTEMGPLLIKRLEKEFHDLFALKDQLKIESKIKNIRFIAELTKFKVAPPEVAFNCLKTCLSEFAHHNVEVACNLLETCGRYLYMNESTHVMTKSLLERMMRVKKSKALGPKHDTMVDNAYFVCKPPESSAIRVKERDPVELYLRKLIYTDLNDKNVHAVMAKLRKLNWKKDSDLILRTLLRVWKGRFNVVHTVASLVSGLARYKELWGVKFMDALMEEIRLCLEKNNYLYNQRLLVYIRFLGELYNYSLIEHPVIFDTLYYLIGISVARENEEVDPTDPPTDLFRIRLVCTLLNTVGTYFTKGPTRSRLDLFLLHFQKYILSKVFFSRDVAFMIDDTFEKIRVSMRQFENFAEAEKAVEAEVSGKANWLPRSLKVQVNQPENDLVAVEDPSEHVNRSGDPDSVGKRGGDSGEGEGDVDGETEGVEDETEGEGEEGEGEDGYDEGDEDEDEDEFDHDAEDEHDDLDESLIHVAPASTQYLPQDEDDWFQKEFDSMLNSDRAERKADSMLSLNRAPVADIAIPMGLVGKETASEEGQDSVAFKVLVKKGGKQKALDLDVPVDDKLAVAHLRAKKSKSDQLAEMKRKVLQYDAQDRKADLDAAAAAANSSETIVLGASSYASPDRTRSPGGSSQSPGMTGRGFGASRGGGPPSGDRKGWYSGPGFDDWDRDEVGTTYRDTRAQNPTRGQGRSRPFRGKR